MRLDNDDRGKILLDAIYNDVDRRIGWNPDECWHCGGEGYTFDCIDDCCIDANIGCEFCTRQCTECARAKHDRLKAIREDVIKSGDVDIACAWLKSIGRWSDDITPERISAELEKARQSSTEAGK